MDFPKEDVQTHHEEDEGWAMWVHWLGAIGGVFLCVMGWLGPLVVLQIVAGESDFAEHHARNALAAGSLYSAIMAVMLIADYSVSNPLLDWLLFFAMLLWIVAYVVYCAAMARAAATGDRPVI